MKTAARIDSQGGVGAHLHQMITIQQSAGDDLFVAQDLAVARISGKIAIGGGSDMEMLGPDAGRERPAFQCRQSVSHGSCGCQASLPKHERSSRGHTDGQHIHRWTADELGHEEIGRPAVQLHRCAELLESTLIQHGNAMSHGHRFHLVVGHIERCRPQGTLEGDDPCPGAGAQLGIQIAERFVHQEHGGFACHGATESHPLFLAA